MLPQKEPTENQKLTPEDLEESKQAKNDKRPDD